jgi:hypothetical protein
MSDRRCNIILQVSESVVFGKIRFHPTEEQSVRFHQWESRMSLQSLIG